MPSTVIFWTELSSTDVKATQTMLFCSYAKVIATQIIRSSSRTG